MNKYIKFLTPIALILLLASCDLNKFPYDAIETSQSFQTIKDAKNWDQGIYAYFKGRQYGIYTFSQDIQIDQLNATLDFGNRNGAPHRWSSFLADDYTIRDVWSAYYSAISNINRLLEGFEGMTLEKDADKALLNQYKGDAYLARAYYYNQLALRWAKSYNPATSNTDLGVPVLTVFDVNAKPARATLADVYKQILSDLSQAKTLLAGIKGKQGSTYFTIDVATALEARVKLYMQDWSGAYTAANSLITSSTYPLITDANNLKKMWVNDFSQEVIMQCFVSKPSELANTNSIYLGYNPTSKKYTPDFIPSQWVIDMYSQDDFRKNIYFTSLPAYIDGQDFTLTMVTKYPGNPDLFTTASTNYEHAPKVFRIAEMYLIAAEAAYKNGTTASAITALNALRQARGLTALGSSVSGDNLMQEIKNERFRELAFEGFRLFDLKRWGEGFERKDPQNLNAISATPPVDFHLKKEAATSNKFVWGLPTNDITINPNLKGQQNPGW